MRHALTVTQNLGTPGMIWPCQLALAELEDAAGQPEAARIHYRAAFDTVEQIAARLTDPILRQRFLDAEPTRKVLAHSAAPVSHAAD
jgi:hypothetical protein